MIRLKVLVVALGLLAAASAPGGVGPNVITREAVSGAEKLIGLDFSDAKRDLMLPGLKEQLENFQSLRKFPLSNAVPPAILFNPIPVGMKFEPGRSRFKASSLGRVKLPANPDELAFYSIGELAALIKSRQLTSEALTRFYLDRLKKYGPKLECVITLTEDLALRQARRADAELRAGKYRGPLHGIPYGVKDLLATKGIRTTWGSAPYTNQIPDSDATVIRRLADAGAVLVGKTNLDQFATGLNGTRSPHGAPRCVFNPDYVSGGSSAGSAAGCAFSASAVPPWRGQGSTACFRWRT